MKPESPVQKNNLVVFPVNIPMCTPISYTWCICIAQFVISNIGPVKPFKREAATVFISLNTCLRCSKQPYHRDGCFEYSQNVFWLRNRKNNFLLCTLICGTDELYPLTGISHVLFISLGSLGD